MTNKKSSNNSSPGSPEGPLHPDLASLEPTKSTEFNLVSDRESLVFEPEGYRRYNALRPSHEQREPAEDDAERDFRATFPDPGGRVRLEGQTYHLETTNGGELPSTALFAGHLAARAGENVVIEWGKGVDVNEEGQPEKFVSSYLPIGPYIEAAKAFPEEMYEPHHANFNMAVLDAYKNNINVVEGMGLSPHDQLIAAHAARNLVEDYHDDRFPYRIPQNRTLPPDHPGNMPPAE